MPEEHGNHDVSNAGKLIDAGFKGIMYGLIPGILVGGLTVLRYGVTGRPLITTLATCVAGGSVFGGSFWFMHNLVRL